MNKYFDLHRHNCRSHDAVNNEEECALQAKKNGYEYLGVSNHGTIDNLHEHIIACEKNNLKAIAGCEIYLQAYKNSKSSHLCLFCKNGHGYDNLVRMFNESILVNDKHVITFDVLSKYHEDLICTTACMSSEISREILKNKFGTAKKMLSRLKVLFGDDLYIEIIPYEQNTCHVQRRVNLQLFHLAETCNVKCILTSDSHSCYHSKKYRHMPDEREIRKRFETMFYSFSDVSYETYQTLIDNLNELANKVAYFDV